MSDAETSPLLKSIVPETKQAKAKHVADGISNGQTRRVFEDGPMAGNTFFREQGFKRMSRNKSEKMRRLQMNNYLMELACLVPSIANAHKKLDKTSILRLSVNYFRFHNEVMAATRGQNLLPDSIYFEEMNSILKEHMHGILIVFNTNGTILYCSECIKGFLGINVVDVLEQPISLLVHADDQQLIQHRLLSPVTADKHCHHKSTSELRRVEVRLLKQTKSQAEYIKVQIIGRLKNLPFLQTARPASTGLGAAGRAVFVGIIRPVEERVSGEAPSLPVHVSTRQYVSRHTLSGAFLDADARCSLVTGYLSSELCGLSAYDFIHQIDMPFAVDAHLKVLCSHGTEIPNTLLRLTIKNRSTVYSHTASHLVIDVWTKKPRYLVSVNTMVTKDEGIRMLEQQEKRRADLDLNRVNTLEVPESVIDDIRESVSVASTLSDSESSSQNQPSPCLPDLSWVDDVISGSPDGLQFAGTSVISSADSKDILNESNMQWSPETSMMVVSVGDGNIFKQIAGREQTGQSDTSGDNSLHTPTPHTASDPVPDWMTNYTNLDGTSTPVSNLYHDVDKSPTTVTTESLFEQKSFGQFDDSALDKPLLFYLLTCENGPGDKTLPVQAVMNEGI